MCPKCNANAVVTKSYTYTCVANVCVICGCSHIIGSSRESLDRQVKGDNWKNPRRDTQPRSNAVIGGANDTVNNTVNSAEIRTPRLPGTVSSKALTKLLQGVA